MTLTRSVQHAVAALALVVATCSAGLAQNAHSGHAMGPAAQSSPADVDRMMGVMRQMMPMMERMRTATPEERARLMEQMRPMMQGMMPMMSGMMGAPAGMPGQGRQGQAAATAPAAPKSEAMRAFEEANATMHRDMAITFTGNTDVDFVRGMIPHHQGAIDMAQVALKFGKDEWVRKLATEVIAAQTREIAEMQDWLRKNPN